MTKEQVNQMDSDELWETLKLVVSRLKEDGSDISVIVNAVITEIE